MNVIPQTRGLFFSKTSWNLVGIKETHGWSIEGRSSRYAKREVSVARKSRRELCHQGALVKG